LPINPRFIPVLLLRGSGVVKTIRFNGGQYLGDPINVVSIFNEKMVDELIILDIDAPRDKHLPRREFLQDLAGECFMPLCYGGGVNTITDVEGVLQVGVEKVRTI